MAGSENEKASARDNVGEEHDDGLWPDFDLSVQSVTTKAVTGQPDNDTEIKKPSESSESKDSKPAKKAAASNS